MVATLVLGTMSGPSAQPDSECVVRERKLRAFAIQFPVELWGGTDDQWTGIGADVSR
jgi:hypothetical protein